MKKFASLVLMQLMLLICGATIGQAQGLCAPRDQVVQRLANQYGETQQSIGLDASNRVMELFASLDKGTWTITITLPSGVSCLIASGQSYETLNTPPQQTKSDA